MNIWLTNVWLTSASWPTNIPLADEHFYIGERLADKRMNPGGHDLGSKRAHKVRSNVRHRASLKHPLLDAWVHGWRNQPFVSQVLLLLLVLTMVLATLKVTFLAIQQQMTLDKSRKQSKCHMAGKDRFILGSLESFAGNVGPPTKESMMRTSV
jgi:hypothetical protein